MPLHFYSPKTLPCTLCGEGFEQHSRVQDAPLSSCPRCGQDVDRRPVQSITSPKLSAGASVSIAKQAGFTVLKRNTDGHFEKQ